MPSRKEIILHNYTTLEKALQKYISKDICPPAIIQGYNQIINS